MAYVPFPAVPVRGSSNTKQEEPSTTPKTVLKILYLSATAVLL